MYECETCGTESAELVTALYHVKGLAKSPLGEYKSKVQVCAECLTEVGNFREHHQNPALKWRLIPV
jgi:hypothetical protein